MPISLDQVAGLEVLASNRCTIFIPSNPGGDGQGLTLRHGSVQLPQLEVSQIMVKLGGFNVAFAGRRSQQNSISVEFTETIDGYATKELILWQQACAGYKNAGGRAKSEYAKEAQIQIYDTMGQQSLYFKVLNMWPMRINNPELGEDSQPYHLQVEFSIDAMDLVAAGNSTITYASSPSFYFGGNPAYETPKTVESVGINVANAGNISFGTTFSDIPTALAVVNNTVRGIQSTNANPSLSYGVYPDLRIG